MGAGELTCHPRHATRTRRSWTRPTGTGARPHLLLLGTVSSRRRSALGATNQQTAQQVSCPRGSETSGRPRAGRVQLALRRRVGEIAARQRGSKLELFCARQSPGGVDEREGLHGGPCVGPCKTLAGSQFGLLSFQYVAGIRAPAD